MRKKELEEKIKQLEKKVDFLCKYDKDEIAIVYTRFTPFYCGNFCVRYIYDGDLKETTGSTMNFPIIIENTEHIAILKDNSDYWKLDKPTGTLHNITGFYKEKTDTEELKGDMKEQNNG